jgi:phosphatidylglycerol:prolipoprotein diacylglycerol transferase
MNNPELILVLTIGTILMSGLMSLQMKWYHIACWKGIFHSLALVVTGVVGSRFWYFVENGSFLGRSLYGAIFLAPFIFFFVAKVLRIPYGYALDFTAPAGCLTLALVKYQCMRDGCCDGIILYLTDDHNYVRFPSQIVEMLAFLTVFFILLKMSYEAKHRGYIFAWFLVLYGSSRFVLDFLRGETVPYVWILSAGSFWSLIALIIGASILRIRQKVQMREVEQD